MAQDMAPRHSELHSLVGVIKEVHKKQSVASAIRREISNTCKHDKNRGEKTKDWKVVSEIREDKY